MDIPALSTGLSQAKLQQDVSVAVTKQAMDATESQSNALINMLNTSLPHPTSGSRFDARI
ncbi:hypothetical protein GCM10011391_31950 [Pullulanibacillus camelliae]|uniref:Motility protein n=1 Tax=Pullulanibacillus camelliae TaxID=1707096 RepID=A0A8J2YKL6_9BACL|nr:YjfB family protein [Pullulanibacillus camelliae]GGE50803.1 hypothetical protein GCM10011391_31950 [Pullulanibacillus camelliae]